MLPYSNHKIKEYIKKHEILEKYIVWKNNIIFSHPELLPFFTGIEIFVKIVYKISKVYLFLLGFLAFITFILLIIYLITGYRFWK